MQAVPEQDPIVAAQKQQVSRQQHLAGSKAGSGLLDCRDAVAHRHLGKALALAAQKRMVESRPMVAYRSFMRPRAARRTLPLIMPWCCQ